MKSSAIAREDFNIDGLVSYGSVAVVEIHNAKGACTNYRGIAPVRKADMGLELHWTSVHRRREKLKPVVSPVLLLNEVVNLSNTCNPLCK